jgi:hypothetical protein
MDTLVNDKGTFFNPDGWILQSEKYPNHEIIYYTYYDELPGMIYYDYIDKRPDDRNKYVGDKLDEKNKGNEKPDNVVQFPSQQIPEVSERDVAAAVGLAAFGAAAWGFIKVVGAAAM